MSRRVGWDRLSAGQRRRYERAGISRRDYAAGASLTSARGHRSTPERPARAEANPDRYRTYLRGHSRAVRVITPRGTFEVLGLAARERSMVGKHDNAVKSYLSTSVIPSPFKSRLSDFEGASVTGFGPESDVPEVFELETRPAALDRLEGQRQLRFESIYPTKA